MSEREKNSPKSRLLKATLQSLHEHGLNETSVGTITKIAGLSRGMITHHFSTKSALLCAAFDHLLGGWTEEILERRSRNHRANIFLMIDAQFSPINFTPENRSAWFAFLEASLHDENIRKVMQTHYGIWRKAFREEIQASLTYEHLAMDAERVATAILAITDGIWLRFALEPDLMTQSEARDICLLVIRQLLSTSPHDPWEPGAMSQ